ncbi:MAG: hypothetical protein ACLR5T_00270 [Veillonella sp.]
MARNHQYLGVNKAVEAYADRKLKDGKLGVFWHTQGSKKAILWLFAQKIRQDGRFTNLVVLISRRA